jgi:hypothetical protein
MTINRGFNLSASVITTETDGGTGDGTTLVDTYDVSATVSTGPVEGSTDAIGAVLYADATAVGEDTFASVSAKANVSAGPVATSANVSLKTEAAAASSDQSYASATGSIELIGGAERSFSLSYDSAVIDQEVDGTTASSSSIDHLYALNIDESGVAAPSPTVDFTEDGVPVETEAEPPVTAPAYDDPCGCGGDGSIPFDGNVALYDVDMDVIADNGIIEVDLSSFAVEDQMSSVTLGSIIMVG